MGDHYILVGPNGSSFDVASYVRADPGPDFGAKDLWQHVFAENALSEGAVLAYETIGKRPFSFPLRLASTSAFPGGLPGIEAWVRQLARPGAYIDLLPENAATAEAVRFDVLTGRYEESYSIHQQRVSRREGSLFLTVSPFGYWPTQILLASVGSVMLPGRITVSPPLVGDVPGEARLAIQPAVPSQYAAGTWLPDFLAWSLGALAGYESWWPAASIGRSLSGGALAGDYAAPGSQIQMLYPSPTQGGWTTMYVATITAAREPAFRGRFRAFAYARLRAAGAPSGVPPFLLSLDSAVSPLQSLASAQAVATLSPWFGATAIPAASPAFSLLDLGDLTLPGRSPSGASLAVMLRLWGHVGTTRTVASPALDLGGIYLLPLDGEQGFLTRGLAWPTVGAPNGATALLTVGQSASSRSQYAGLDAGATDLAAVAPQLTADYRSAVRVRVGASAAWLDLITGARRTGIPTDAATGPRMIHAGPAFAAVSLSYQPRFAFLESV